MESTVHFQNNTPIIGIEFPASRNKTIAAFHDLPGLIRVLALGTSALSLVTLDGVSELRASVS
jgi:hypothetical protein